MSLAFNVSVRLAELEVGEPWARSNGEQMISIDHPGGSWLSITEPDLPEVDELIGKLQLAKQRLKAAASGQAGGAE